MKAKYIFTKIGYRKNDLEVMNIVPETDEDYDVADIFLSDYYSDEGETISVEANDLDEAVEQANRWFGTCATANNVLISYTCDNAPALSQNDHYRDIPIPVKTLHHNFPKWSTLTDKRTRKYYGKKTQRPVYDPEGLIFDYRQYTYQPY